MRESCCLEAYMVFTPSRRSRNGRRRGTDAAATAQQYENGSVDGRNSFQILTAIEQQQEALLMRSLQPAFTFHTIQSISTIKTLCGSSKGPTQFQRGH